MAAKRKSPKSAHEKASNIQARLLETVQQIWLAGLGAASKAQQGAPRLLEDLIEEGERVDARLRSSAASTVRSVVGNLQDSLEARMSGVRGQASDAVDSLEKLFRTRVHRALTQLGVPSAEEIESLSKRVDALNANIGKLSRTRKAPGRPRGRPRASARPRTVSRTQSASAPAP